MRLNPRRIMMATALAGAVCFALRFDVCAAPPVLYHGYDPEKAPWVLVDRHPRDLDVGDVVLYREPGCEENMAEICMVTADDLTLHAPGHGPYGVPYSYEVAHINATGRVIMMFGDWE